MSDTVYIVAIDYPARNEPKIVVFEDEQDAYDFCSVRGGAGVEDYEVFDHADAQKMIEAEAKERRDEEKFDRMRDEGEI